MTLRVLSLFSGAGGFDIGLEQSGMKTVFQCEINKNCQETLKYHWPNVPKWDNVSTLTGKYILENTDGIDVVAWGSPCQDLSRAGTMQGLLGKRSSLFFEGIRIIKELREISNNEYPKWSIWENVAGALSSRDGKDFGQVLYEMDEIGACFSEWRMLDAQYFGIPQRRRRVFVVSCFDTTRSERSERETQSISKSSKWNIAEGFKKGESNARHIEERSREISGDGQVDSSYKQYFFSSNGFERLVQQDVSGTISAGENKYLNNIVLLEKVEKDTIVLDGTRVNDVRVYEDGIVPTLKNRMGTGGNNVPLVTQKKLSPNLTDNEVVVRKLTTIECERLMGWPDNHTLYRADGKVNSNTNRYGMCGNGVVSPVAKWIGEQIQLWTEGKKETVIADSL